MDSTLRFIESNDYGPTESVLSYTTSLGTQTLSQWPTPSQCTIGRRNSSTDGLFNKQTLSFPGPGTYDLPSPDTISRAAGARRRARALDRRSQVAAVLAAALVHLRAAHAPALGAAAPRRARVGPAQPGPVDVRLPRAAPRRAAPRLRVCVAGTA